ncbi:hypothetical protein PAP_07635 [Palaeococcus pacificus DY20341]|uniref:SAM-dependent MTase TRM10-type domain-containing protein n=1 Tax=Palaeococcus pacificus DY20341 TaxID=1343739 RepID=A0A075LUV1_9EURY|nr:tRNA (guanine(9)-/adenine(9)-N1)-methyltransferase [Palaeococcus pacificus]AIF69916.1 hypothetical protein PAP_07635 [Palaeococcus pacificus DY20341]
MKKLGDLFKELLREKGIESLGTLSKRIPNRKSQDIIQDIAIAVLEEKGFIGKVEDGAALSWDFSGKRVEPSKFAFIPLKLKDRFEIILTPEELRAKLEEQNYPYFIIDLMHWEKHTPREKKKVAFQASRSYGTLRDYLVGDSLIVTWANEEFKKLLKGMPLDRGNIIEKSTAEFLKEKGISEVVLLDPNGDKDLSSEDFNVKAFILGGIVDMGGTKRGTTSQIAESLEKEGIKVKKRKITLRGDVIGVPDRINLILEILLKMLTEDKDMERAILDVQAPLQARWRLRKEIPKRKIRFLIDGKKFLVVEKELYDELKEWLNIRWEDFVQVLRELGFVALERRRIHHLKKLSSYRLINGKGHYVILLKKAAMLCYNC